MRNPKTKWIGGDFNKALPVHTTITSLDVHYVSNGLHVLDLYARITCGGLRTMLEGGYHISCYTCVEIDDLSCTITKRALRDLERRNFRNCQKRQFGDITKDYLEILCLPRVRI